MYLNSHNQLHHTWVWDELYFFVSPPSNSLRQSGAKVPHIRSSLTLLLCCSMHLIPALPLCSAPLPFHYTVFGRPLFPSDAHVLPLWTTLRNFCEFRQRHCKLQLQTNAVQGKLAKIRLFLSDRLQRSSFSALFRMNANTAVPTHLLRLTCIAVV